MKRCNEHPVRERPARQKAPKKGRRKHITIARKCRFSPQSTLQPRYRALERQDRNDKANHIAQEQTVQQVEG